MKKLFNRISFFWAVLTGKRYIGWDYGNIDMEAKCVWFYHDGKAYITDIEVTERSAQKGAEE